MPGFTWAIKHGCLEITNITVPVVFSSDSSGRNSRHLLKGDTLTFALITEPKAADALLAASVEISALKNTLQVTKKALEDERAKWTSFGIAKRLFKYLTRETR